MIRQRAGSAAAQRAGHSLHTYSMHTYSIAKAAVVHASRVVAAELAEHGVRVNSISPGAIVTGIFGKGVGSVLDAQAALLNHSFTTIQPSPRAALPDDIARGALYLASDASSFVAGQDFLIDGGLISGLRFSQSLAGRLEVQQALLADAAARSGPAGSD
jgi:NAD(P)-dependent dehydrogenase (short-subunit alcohol dehydrogenase family)